MEPSNKITRRITLREWTAKRKAVTRAPKKSIPPSITPFSLTAASKCLPSLVNTLSATTATSGDGEEPPPFFKFPAEIRLLIYEEAFRGNIVDNDKLTAESAEQLFTCKQFKKEARDAFFKMSTFQAEYLSTLRIRLSKYHPRYKKQIRHVVVDHTNRQLEWPKDWELCSSHAELDIDCAQRDAFTLTKDLKAAGLPNAEVKVKVVLAHNKNETRVVTTASPFHAWAEAVKELQAQQEDPPKGELRCALRFVANAARFYEYDHVAAERCWHSSWGYNAEHVCSCPKKTLNEASV